MVWDLKIEKAGTYFLWGRVLAPTSGDDSFFVRVLPDLSAAAERSAWSTGVHKDWQWTPVCLNKEKKPAALQLPAGTVRLEISTREDGTKIDRLFITDDPTARPE